MPAIITAPLRRKDLNVNSVAGELLMYDPTNDHAHVLNGAAAFVWEHCDGTQTVDEIARAMALEFHTPADTQVVWYALEQLSKKRLLMQQVHLPPTAQTLSRRQFLKRATIAAAAVAVVTTLAAPTPAHAQSGCVSSPDSTTSC